MLVIHYTRCVLSFTVFMLFDLTNKQTKEKQRGVGFFVSLQVFVSFCFVFFSFL